MVNLTSNVGLLMNGQPIINIGSKFMTTFVGIGAGYVAQAPAQSPPVWDVRFLVRTLADAIPTAAKTPISAQSAGYFGTTALHNTLCWSAFDELPRHEDGFCTAVGGDAMCPFASGTGFCTAIGAGRRVFRWVHLQHRCRWRGALTGASGTVVIKRDPVTTTDTVTLTFTGEVCRFAAQRFDTDDGRGDACWRQQQQFSMRASRMLRSVRLSEVLLLPA